MKQIYLTKLGFDEFEAELAELNTLFGQITERVRTARESGDLGENAEYTAACLELESVKYRATKVKDILQNAQVIKKPLKDNGVQLGSTVKMKGNGQEKLFIVVDTVEADPLNGKLSSESPIGRALLGKKEGDMIEIKTPGKTVQYVITTIMHI
ncbi:MAG TPA: GreA/GreB family elongation factor [Nevskiaceae bacterium]|nr:GreA/GreB family elongation factor [Nevskiaceae bacterium]